MDGRRPRLRPAGVGLALVLAAALARGAEPYERPPDPDFPFQWSLENRGQPFRKGDDRVGKPDADIDATEAFAAGYTGAGVVMAIIGTGIPWRSSSLRGSLWSHPGEIPGNGIDDDGNGLIDDVHGYDFAEGDPDVSIRGTHDLQVAEIALAPHDSRTIAGIAPGARLMILKIADDSGHILVGPLPHALAYALHYGARVIFMPWSSHKGRCGDPALRFLDQLLTRAAKEALIIAGSPGEWPACHPGVVSVRATRPDDRSQGLPSPDVDFGAPGSDGRTKVATSYAIGVVAGVAALLFAQDPERSPSQVRTILKRTADRVHPEIRPYRGGWNSLFGSGRINAARALGTDYDGDGILDADDPDADGDGIPDLADACTLDPDPDCSEPPRRKATAPPSAAATAARLSGPTGD
ncbi:MAG: S8 family serine peptidase [Myxococcota bacterium]